MKYTKDQRLDIGRRIYEGEISRFEAATEYGIGSNTAREYIIDDYSEMEIVSFAPAHISDAYAFFYLLNITCCARGISIQNAKYPLADGEITCEYQYGLSNEVLHGKTAIVSVHEGKLLLIKDR